MGRYDKEDKSARESATKQTKEEFGDILAIPDGGLEARFPVEGDRELMKELRAKIQSITDRNELITASKAIVVKMTVEGAKMAKELCKALN